MGHGLFKYAEMNQQEAPALEDQKPAEGMDRYIKRQSDIEHAKELMQSIEAQLQQGRPPQYVLYTALRVIGLLSGNTAWEARQRAQLDTIYKDLDQESLFADNAAKAEARLDEQRAQYIDKTRRKLKRIESETGTIYGLVQAVLDHLDALDTGDEIESPGQAVYRGDGVARLHNRYMDQQARARKQAEKYDLNNLDLPPNN